METVSQNYLIQTKTHPHSNPNENAYVMSSTLLGRNSVEPEQDSLDIVFLMFTIELLLKLFPIIGNAIKSRHSKSSALD